jgi:hypothetical protein
MVVKLAADLAHQELRERTPEAVTLTRHACEEVERIRTRLEGHELSPAEAVEAAVGVFERLCHLRARVTDTDARGLHAQTRP